MKALLPTLAFISTLLTATSLVAQEEHQGNGAGAEVPPLGRVDFRVQCEEAARAAFDEALAMTHHMMYAQARGRFEAIVEQYPDCAMAHWGIAKTLFQPLWATRPSEEDLQRGWRESQWAAELAHSERERHLIDATSAFFREPGKADYATRQGRWAEAMQSAYRAEPEDDDIAALYALSLLARAQGADDPHPLHEQAEDILRAINAREPSHPGAIHYIIHGDDIDGRSDRNLEIVATYGQVAPDVPHALHMTTHIFVRLGDWPGVIEWNRRSAEAALANPSGEHVSHHYLHAQDYIIYAHLQRGEDEQAQQVLAEAREHGPMQPTVISAFHSATMPARIAVERRDWTRTAALEPRTPEELPWDASLGLWATSQTWLARGLGAVHGDDIDDAEQALERVQALRADAEEQGETLIARYIRIDEHILAGWIAHAAGEADQAVEQMRAAARIEESVEKHPVTPGALLPPNESLGDLLMVLERPAEALAAYQASDAVWPARYNTLLGAARAAHAAGDEAAADWYGKLLETAPQAQRESLKEAHEMAAG
ncbi:hypothetical protein M8009_03450 [Halomonas sp. ATCH28]|uniref:Tetratricopeptide repeat protein n=1 Tax=Halomonas gemina TaxID=2945105 RepID=A0ABT0SY40_9GAMM|nr:hypothetical protein [Halomonas gemina]MCL7939359.1 hypothetical protein [Halomonas gemina]